MKKRTVILIILGIVLFLGGAFLLIRHFAKLPRSAIEISGNVVDNDLNNCFCAHGGNLVRIGEKLYYNYEKNGFNYGIYAIDETGSERVVWKGWRGVDMLIPYFSIKKENNELLIYDYLEDELFTYSEKTKNTVPEMLLNSVSGIRLNFIEHEKEYYFIKLSKCDEIESLSHYHNNDTEEISKSVCESINIIDDKLFYGEQFDYNSGILIQYNLTAGETKELCKLGGYITNILCDDEYIVCSSSNGENGRIYAVRSTDNNPTLRLIYSESENEARIRTFNVYDKKVYLALESGLICHDLETDEEVVLSEKNLEQCYIVDDMWVYFVDSHKTLWRVTQDGKTTERVFG